ncbi:MAG: peroxiredoxin family protein [Hoylesella buccalis]
MYSQGANQKERQTAGSAASSCSRQYNSGYQDERHQWQTQLLSKPKWPKNKITILDFWASWCGPCVQEAPSVVALYNDYHAKGLGIIGISLDKDEASWKQAVDKLDMKWTHLSDLQGWDNAAAQLFNVNSIPHTVVVDEQGTILVQGLRGDDLRQFIADKLD